MLLLPRNHRIRHNHRSHILAVCQKGWLAASFLSTCAVISSGVFLLSFTLAITSLLFTSADFGASGSSSHFTISCTYAIFCPASQRTSTRTILEARRTIRFASFQRNCSSAISFAFSSLPGGRSYSNKTSQVLLG